MEDNNEVPAAPQGGTQPEVSQADATKTAFPTARQEQSEQGNQVRSDIDELADKLLQAKGTEEFPRAIMEFYEAKAAEIRQLPEDRWPYHGLDKYEQVSAKIREQLGLPKLQVTVGEIVKGMPANSPKRIIYHPLK